VHPSLAKLAVHAWQVADAAVHQARLALQDTLSMTIYFTLNEFILRVGVCSIGIAYCLHVVEFEPHIHFKVAETINIDIHTYVDTHVCSN
jgi:hypothetical protein